MTTYPQPTDPVDAFTMADGTTVGHDELHGLDLGVPWVNVKAFGAKGDGVTDDYAAIVAAIKALPYMNAGQYAGQDGLAPDVARHAVGGICYFPPGVYCISEGIAHDFRGGTVSGYGLRKILTIVGAGATASQIKFIGNTPQAMITLGSNGSNKSTRGGTDKNAFSDNNLGGIRDIGLNGNGLASDCVLLVETGQNIIERCMMGDAINNDIYATNDPNSGNDYGSIGLKIRDNFFGFYGRTDENHIECVDPHDLTIQGNEFNFALKRNIYLRGGGGNLFRILNNSIEGINTATQVANGAEYPSLDIGIGKGIISGNAFEDVITGANSRFISIADSVNGISIYGNDFAEAGLGSYGIEIGDAVSEVTIYGNQWTNNGSVANLLIGTSCDDIWVWGEQNGYGGTAGYYESNTFKEPAIMGLTRLNAGGFERLAINMEYPSVNAGAAFEVNGQAFTDGVSTFTKAGAVVDGDFTNVEDGLIAVDETNHRIYVRDGAAWRYIPTITAAAGAYTQTYSTADKTHAAPTAAALTVTDGAGTNDNTIGAITADASVIAAVQELADEINKLVTDLADVKQLVNSVIDDLQSVGLVG